MALTVRAEQHQQMALTVRTSVAQDFGVFMRDDAELLRAANAQWAVVPMTDEVCQ
jgi:hypothetical protein